MKIKQMNVNLVLEENWDDIKRPEDGHKFINSLIVAARDELQSDILTTVTLKVFIKGLPQNHQLALDQFLDGFYNPNKKILEDSFAVSSSIVHDRSFTLYKTVGEKLCKVIG
ncbi:hypothetical protein [Escherichia phage pEC-M719-6WT.1]|uniref:Uncharacterized protein n=1 Tax=Escherichia phage pEC-M719-6WT.1 TaxID=3056220 RepID=A0AA51U8L5_9CAUD|nr:hypothetical protein [Escherichia phage pEC-M719-6WT.1]